MAAADRTLLLEAARAHHDGLAPLMRSLRRAASDSSALSVAAFEDAVAAFIARQTTPSHVHFKWARFVDGTSTVKLAPFVAWLRGHSSSRRAAAVAGAWRHIARPGGVAATLPRSTLLQRFVAWDRWLPANVFLRGWPAASSAAFAFDLPASSSRTATRGDRAVAFQEFAAYWSDVGAPIEDDAEFGDMLRKCWSLPVTPAPATAAAASSAASLQQRKKDHPQRSLGASLVPLEGACAPLVTSRARDAGDYERALPYPEDRADAVPSARGRKKVAHRSSSSVPFATTSHASTASDRGALTALMQPPLTITLGSARHSRALASSATRTLTPLGGIPSPPRALHSPRSPSATVLSISGFVSPRSVRKDPLEAELAIKRAERRVEMSERLNSMKESLDATLRPLPGSSIKGNASKGHGLASPMNPNRVIKVERPPRRPLGHGTFNPIVDNPERANDGRSVAAALNAGCEGPLGDPYDYSVALDDATSVGGGRRLVPDARLGVSRPGYRPRRKRAPQNDKNRTVSSDFSLALGGTGTIVGLNVTTGAPTYREHAGRTAHWHTSEETFGSVHGIEGAEPASGTFERRDWGANLMTTNGVDRSSARWRPAAECDQLRTLASHDRSLSNTDPDRSTGSETAREKLARKEAEDAASFEEAVLKWRTERTPATIVRSGGAFGSATDRGGDAAAEPTPRSRLTAETDDAARREAEDAARERLVRKEAEDAASFSDAVLKWRVEHTPATIVRSGGAFGNTEDYQEGGG